MAGIEPVVGALRSGDVDALIDTLAEGRQVATGEGLFRLLFGPTDTDTARVLIPVYGLGEGAGVNALHGPVHVRIFVDDDSPIRHELPWRAAEAS